MIPDTNWRTPAPWSPAPNESWGIDDESENSEESGSAETNWWSETGKESENSEETDKKKNWWRSWNHGKNQGKQYMKSKWHQNYMDNPESRDSSDSQENAAMAS